MNREKITEWVKWAIWAGSLVGMFITWRVDKAQTKIEHDMKIIALMEDVVEIKQDLKDTKNYALENKDNITRITTVLELYSE